MKKLMYWMIGAGLFIASCSENPATMPDTGESGSLRSDNVAISTSSAAPISMMELYHEGNLENAFVRMHPVPSAGATQHATPNLLYTYMIDSVYNDNHELTVLKPVTNSFGEATGKKIWREMHILVNRGFEPQQFTSAADVMAAASGAQPSITIVPGTRIFLIKPASMH